MEEHNSSLLIRELQRVLQHLYDPSQLRKSLLPNLFSLENPENPVSALQKLIISAIHGLKPSKETPRHAESWRTYQILSYLYVEQSSQSIVANTLGLSVRQLRRHQRTAEDALADFLRRQYNLDDTKERLVLDIQQDREKELEWLHESIPPETITVADLLESIHKIIAPVLSAKKIRVESEIAEQMPLLHGNIVALRQGLMNIIMASINLSCQESIKIQTVRENDQIAIYVLTHCNSNPNIEDSVRDRFQMAQKMIEVFGGQFSSEITQQPVGSLMVKLLLPFTEQIPILVIDDNNDTLLLFRRYLTGTRYRVSSTRDPEQALALAQEILPTVIIMDILLPGIDGWELLGRIKAHPKTHHIPVIACTISPEEQLALALGASAFLRKPVNRETLIYSLDHIISVSS